MILATYTTFLSLSSNPVAEIFLIITFLLFVYEAVIIVAIDVLFVEWVSLCLTWVLLVWIIVIGVVLVVRVLRICWWPLFFIVIVNIKFIFQLPRALQYWILFFNFQRISTTDVKVLFVSLVSYVSALNQNYLKGTFCPFTIMNLELSISWILIVDLSNASPLRAFISSWRMLRWCYTLIFSANRLASDSSVRVFSFTRFKYFWSGGALKNPCSGSLQVSIGFCLVYSLRLSLLSCYSRPKELVSFIRLLGLSSSTALATYLRMMFCSSSVRLRLSLNTSISACRFFAVDCSTYCVKFGSIN